MTRTPPTFDPAAWSAHALLTCEEMRTAEQTACAQSPVDLHMLMHNAGHAVASVIVERWSPCRVAVLCGPGNNGGDGFVIAEALRRAGWSVSVFATEQPRPSPEAQQAIAQWQGETHDLAQASFDQTDLIVDALLGTGLQRPVEGEIARAIDCANASGLPIVAVDIPSGVDGNTGRVRGKAIRATITVTFFRPKIGHAVLPGAEHCGEVVAKDIGIDHAVLNAHTPRVAENDPALWLKAFPFPEKQGHKYDRGHALIYGGAVMTGAARLAARAAQRAGAGLVTLAAPPESVALYAAALESVIVRTAERLEDWQQLVRHPKISTLVIGPGAGIHASLRDCVLEALSVQKACVLDADALTVFSDDPETLFKALHPACVLTPHEGEFARLFGSVVDGNNDKVARVREATKTAGCVVLLKGADTVIADPEGWAVVNRHAPPWLATAGAGDVLAGMIGGLLASGMPVFQATAAAAWMHGEAAAGFGPGLIAEDLVAGLPSVLKGLSSLV